MGAGIRGAGTVDCGGLALLSSTVGRTGVAYTSGPWAREGKATARTLYGTASKVRRDIVSASPASSAETRQKLGRREVK